MRNLCKIQKVAAQNRLRKRHSALGDGEPILRVGGAECRLRSRLANPFSALANPFSALHSYCMR